MTAADHAEFETQDRETDEALARARELHDDHPHLTADLILAALDDEYAGSTIWPSGSETFRKEVDRILRR